MPGRPAATRITIIDDNVIAQGPLRDGSEVPTHTPVRALREELTVRSSPWGCSSGSWYPLPKRYYASSVPALSTTSGLAFDAAETPASAGIAEAPPRLELTDARDEDQQAAPSAETSAPPGRTERLRRHDIGPQALALREKSASVRENEHRSVIRRLLTPTTHASPHPTAPGSGQTYCGPSRTPREAS